MQNFEWNLARVLAHTLAEETRQEFGGVEAYNVSGGSGSTWQNNKFARKGTSSTSKETSLPSFLSDLFTSNAKGAEVPASLGAKQNDFTSGLLQATPEGIPGKSTWDTLKGIDPTGYTGSATLGSIATQDPYSGNYKASTDAKYTDNVDQALARVQSGPDNVRGGQARTALTKGEAVNRMALDRGEELRKEQMATAGMATNATQIMQAIEQGRRAVISGAQGDFVKSWLQTQGLATDASKSVDARRGSHTMNLASSANVLGKTTGTATDNMDGTGAQYGHSSNLEGGLQCCFIFLEALNGKLPWFIRRGRDMFQSTKRRNGYVRMSKWLVPLMQKSKIVRGTVNTILIKPFLKQGAWFFGDESAKPHWKYYSYYCQVWFGLWNLMGKEL